MFSNSFSNVFFKMQPIKTWFIKILKKFSIAQTWFYNYKALYSSLSVLPKNNFVFPVSLNLALFSKQQNNIFFSGS